MLLRTVLIFVFSLLAVSLSFAQGIQKGLWEITTETVMEGVPVKIPPTTTQSCVTSERYIPNDTEKNTNCKMLYSKQEGNTASWKAVCKERGSTVETTGKMTYSGKTFTGQADTVVIEGNEKVITKVNMKGRYLGPCK